MRVLFILYLYLVFYVQNAKLQNHKPMKYNTNDSVLSDDSVLDTEIKLYSNVSMLVTVKPNLNNYSETLSEVKNLLVQLENKVNYLTNDGSLLAKDNTNYTYEKNMGKDSKVQRKAKYKWEDWSEWSACSVSCGRGRRIRWRHCKDNCNGVETEMEEKTCQLPACAPIKLFGFFG